MESLAKRLLNNPGLIALCVADELEEIKAIIKRNEHKPGKNDQEGAKHVRS